MAHHVVPAAEAVLDVEFKVLDHGFVALVDYMGSDARVIQAARTSYGDGTTPTRSDEALLRYLVDNQHMSPFEQVALTFCISMPLFVANHFVRHRTAKLNAESFRYSVKEDIDGEAFYLPEIWRTQSTVNKQGSGGGLDAEENAKATATFLAAQQHAFEAYNLLLGQGVAREQARMILPQNIYVRWYWQCDLRNLLHFASLRADPHAQWETQQFAYKLLELTKAVTPITAGVWDDVTKNALKLSRSEQIITQRALEACGPGVERTTLDEVGKDVLGDFWKPRSLSTLLIKLGKILPETMLR